MPWTKVITRFPAELLERIEKAAGAGERSEWIRQACEKHLAIAELAAAHSQQIVPGPISHDHTKPIPPLDFSP
jgi:metal-responsive CopG/Arc/MetJ family transcriptional regulator